MLNKTSPLISPSPGDPACLVLGPVPAPQLMGLQLQTALIVTDDVSTTGKSGMICHPTCSLILNSSVAIVSKDVIQSH